MNTNDKFNESLKRQKRDLERRFRIVKKFEFPYVLKNSPVEIEEGNILSDTQTCEIFASFVLKNVTERPVTKLTIRLAFFMSQKNIPYEVCEFTYCHEDLKFGIIKKRGEALKLKLNNKRKAVFAGETFGTCVFIPIPEAYFSKLDITLVSIEYGNGDFVTLEIPVMGESKRYNELDDMSKLAYSWENIYKSAEEDHPTVVIPQFSENVWLCCCGQKNLSKNEYCERCGREKEYQQSSLCETAISQKRHEFINDPRNIAFHNKAKFVQNKYLENKEDIQKKIDMYEKAKQNLKLEEERKNKKISTLIPKLILCAVIIWLIAFAIKLVESILHYGMGLGDYLKFFDISLVNNLIK